MPCGEQTRKKKDQISDEEFLRIADAAAEKWKRGTQSHTMSKTNGKTGKARKKVGKKEGKKEGKK